MVRDANGQPSLDAPSLMAVPEEEAEGDAESRDMGDYSFQILGWKDADTHSASASADRGVSKS